MQIPIDLDRSSRTPLVSQLSQQLRDAIRLGRIPAGARLPSSRSLAEQLGIGRNTVVNAYEALTIEGLVESRASSGFFAARDLPGAAPQPVFPQGSAPPEAAVGAPLPSPVMVRAPPRINARRARNFFDFAPGRPDVDLFPVKIWRRLLQDCLSHGGAAGLSQHVDPAGLPALRAAISEHVSISRGLVADPSRIVIGGGTQESLTLLARLFLSPGRAAAVEDPCYQRAVAVFEAAGARPISVPVDDDGIVTARLPEQGAALLYCTPGHQFPTGHALSPARRAELVAWGAPDGLVSGGGRLRQRAAV